MSDESVLETISRHAVLPVIAIDSVADALPLADALLEGGLPVAEITFRTSAAVDVIRKLSDERPELLVGAGTVLTLENVQAAKDAGARFAIAPGLNPEIVTRAQQIGLPFIPGVATPSEIERGLSLGCRVLKFYPVAALGGIATIKTLAGPYRHTGVRFVPSGGVDADNVAAFLAVDLVAAVGGTWLARPEDLAAGDWKAIAQRCRDVVQVVQRARGA